MKAKRTKITRVVPGAKVRHLGVDRAVVLELDTVAGTVAVRLEGCRIRKTYFIQDLFQWGPQLKLL